MKIELILILTILGGALSSCKHYSVFLFDAQNILRPDPTYIIQNRKNSFEFYNTSDLNEGYYENLQKNGASTDELEKIGQKKTESGIHEFYQVDIDSLEIEYIHSWSESKEKVFDTVRIPLKKMDTWFEVKPFVFLDYTSGNGVSCLIQEPWHLLYGRRIEDTICIFNSGSQTSVFRYEFFPCDPTQLKDSTEFSNPIILLIDKATGVPLLLEFTSIFGDRNNPIYTYSHLRCVDHRKFWLTRKKLFKFLW